MFFHAPQTRLVDWVEQICLSFTFRSMAHSIFSFVQFISGNISKTNEVHICRRRDSLSTSSSKSGLSTSRDTHLRHMHHGDSIQPFAKYCDTCMHNSKRHNPVHKRSTTRVSDSNQSSPKSQLRSQDQTRTCMRISPQADRAPNLKTSPSMQLTLTLSGRAVC